MKHPDNGYIFDYFFKLHFTLLIYLILTSSEYLRFNSGKLYRLKNILMIIPMVFLF